MIEQRRLERIAELRKIVERGVVARALLREMLVLDYKAGEKTAYLAYLYGYANTSGISEVVRSLATTGLRRPRAPQKKVGKKPSGRGRWSQKRVLTPKMLQP